MIQTKICQVRSIQRLKHTQIISLPTETKMHHKYEWLETFAQVFKRFQF